MMDINVKGSTIYTIAAEKLTEEDYNKLMPELKKLIGQNDKINWYFEMQDFKGWEVSAFWKDLKFDFAHTGDFHRIAMVGDKEWEKWMTVLMKPFTPADVKYFELADRETAKKWIEQ